MTVEEIVKEHLSNQLDELVTVGIPEQKPEIFVVLNKTGGNETNHIRRAIMTVESYAPSMFMAATLNEKVKAVMRSIAHRADVSKAVLNSDYNASDTTRRMYRYQAVYEITLM